MKKVLRAVATVVAVVLVTVGLNFWIKGIPLFGAPKADDVVKVVVEHNDYPDEVKEHTEKDKIEVALALTGYLRYAPLKALSDDSPLIKITYIMSDGTDCVVSANKHTVWWNGKASALRDEGEFVKWCTAVFYLQN